MCAYITVFIVQCAACLSAVLQHHNKNSAITLYFTKI